MLLRLLRLAERDGRCCATLVLLIGTVFGVGLTRLLQGGFNLSATQSVQVLVVVLWLVWLLVLQ
jgi:hypothetical protein